MLILTWPLTQKNTNSDLSLLSPELSVSSSSSAGSANIALSSSLALVYLWNHYLLPLSMQYACSLTQDPSMIRLQIILAGRYVFGYVHYFLAGPSLPVASSTAQLPASPGTGSPILVPSFVNTFTSPTMSLLSLPVNLLTPCASSFLLGSSSQPSLSSLQQPFIVAHGHLAGSIQNSSADRCCKVNRSH